MLFLCSTRPAGSGKAMKLGSKNKDIDMFVDMLKSEGEGMLKPDKLLNTYAYIFLDYIYIL